MWSSGDTIVVRYRSVDGALRAARPLTVVEDGRGAVEGRGRARCRDRPGAGDGRPGRRYPRRRRAGRRGAPVADGMGGLRPRSGMAGARAAGGVGRGVTVAVRELWRDRIW